MIVREEIILHLKKFTFDLVSMDGGLRLCELQSLKEISGHVLTIAGWPVKEQIDYIIDHSPICKMRLYVGDTRKYPMRVELHDICFYPEYPDKWNRLSYRRILIINAKEYVELGRPKQIKVEVTIRKMI